MSKRTAYQRDYYRKNAERRRRERLELSIPILLGTERVPLKAKFRYRIAEMRLSLSYDLHRPSQAWDAAIQATTQTIRAALKYAPFFLGSAG